MKRIIKNNYQPNSVRVICPICKSVFEFNPEFRRIFGIQEWRGLYRTIDQLPMLHEDAQDRGYVSLSYKKTVI